MLVWFVRDLFVRKPDLSQQFVFNCHVNKTVHSVFDTWVFSNTSKKVLRVTIKIDDFVKC